MCASSLDCRLVCLYAFTIEYTVMRSIMNMFYKRMPYLVFIRNESILAMSITSFHIFKCAFSANIFYSMGLRFHFEFQHLVYYSLIIMRNKKKTWKQGTKYQTNLKINFVCHLRREQDMHHRFISHLCKTQY